MQPATYFRSACGECGGIRGAAWIKAATRGGCLGYLRACCHGRDTEVMRSGLFTGLCVISWGPAAVMTQSQLVLLAVIMLPGSSSLSDS
jgi:hypothetical protein